MPRDVREYLITKYDQGVSHLEDMEAKMLDYVAKLGGMNGAAKKHVSAMMEVEGDKNDSDESEQWEWKHDAHVEGN